MEEIIQEKISADHLLYVSLKYTKTCDVILNLLARWKSLIEISFDELLRDGVENGKIPQEPISPKHRIEFMKLYFKKNLEIQGFAKWDFGSSTGSTLTPNSPNSCNFACGENNASFTIPSQVLVAKATTRGTRDDSAATKYFATFPCQQPFGPVDRP